MSGLPHDPKLTKLSRWCLPDPWDTFVAASCSYFCFGGPFVVAGAALIPFLFVLPVVFAWWIVAEGAWLVRRRYLRQRHETFTPAPDNPARRKQMERMLLMKDDVIPDFREFLREWFRGADPRLIRRENVREFVRYGFYGGMDGPLGQAEEEEIEWWIGEVEHTWGIAFEPGRTDGLKFMAHMREPLRVFHQPLLYYAYSHCAESLAGLVLRCWGFTWHKCGDNGVTYWLRLGSKPLRTPSRTPSPGLTPSSSYEAFLNDTANGDTAGDGALNGSNGVNGVNDPNDSPPIERQFRGEPCSVCGGVDNRTPKYQGGWIKRTIFRRGGGGWGDNRKCFAGCAPRRARLSDGTRLMTRENDATTPTWAPTPAPAPTPLVFLHGLGIGLPPYLWTVAHALRARADRPIALVCLPEISMRAVTRVPSPDDLVDAVENLCRRHALQRPCLLGHSFGSFLVARACQRSKVAAVVMIDPVSSCLMLPAVVSRVMYQLDDRWRELIGRESAGMEAVDPEAKRALGLSRRGAGGVFSRNVSVRDKAELVTRYLFTLARDWFVVKELSATVALCRQFWWFQVCAFAEDLPEKTLMVLQSYDAILDAERIARHALHRESADVLWVEGFSHGEILGPQGFEARKQLLEFIQNLDGK